MTCAQQRFGMVLDTRDDCLRVERRVTLQRRFYQGARLLLVTQEAERLELEPRPRV
jgi:hypothetical protein